MGKIKEKVSLKKCIRCQIKTRATIFGRQPSIEINHRHKSWNLNDFLFVCLILYLSFFCSRQQFSRKTWQNNHLIRANQNWKMQKHGQRSLLTFWFVILLLVFHFQLLLNPFPSGCFKLWLSLGNDFFIRNIFF